jgi:hypothetical protein
MIAQQTLPTLSTGVMSRSRCAMDKVATMKGASPAKLRCPAVFKWQAAPTGANAPTVTRCRGSWCAPWPIGLSGRDRRMCAGEWLGRPGAGAGCDVTCGRCRACRPVASRLGRGRCSVGQGSDRSMRIAQDMNLGPGRLRSVAKPIIRGSDPVLVTNAMESTNQTEVIDSTESMGDARDGFRTTGGGTSP